MAPLSLDSLEGPKAKVLERSDGLFDWHLIGTNGEIMCGSMQGYTTRADAVEGYKRCAKAMAENYAYNFTITDA